MSARSSPLMSFSRRQRSLIVGGSEVLGVSSSSSTSTENDILWPTYAAAFAWSGISATMGWGCGGALIHDDIILTGAHCQWVYHVGGDAWVGAKNSSDCNNNNKNNSTNYFTVSAVVIHPDYTNEKPVYNDIMLVKINATTHTVNVNNNNNNNAMTMELYDYNKDPNVPANNGDYVRVVGFGTTSENNGNISEMLREVDVEYFNNKKCPSTWPTYDANLQLCAGTNEGGKDSCNSDSGSPLFLVREKEDDGRGRRPVVVGLVGDGIGCGRAGIPALYTRVSTFGDWIHQTICNISSTPPLTCGDDNDGDGGGGFGEGGDDVFPTTSSTDAWLLWGSAASHGSSTRSVEHHAPIGSLSGSTSITLFGTFMASMLIVMAILKLFIYGRDRRRRQGYETVESINNKNDNI